MNNGAKSRTTDKSKRRCLIDVGGSYIVEQRPYDAHNITEN